MKAYLLRHGATAYNDTGITQSRQYDISLTDTAIAEFKEALPSIVNALSGSVSILASPALRAKQTGTMLKAELDADIEVIPVTEEDLQKFQDLVDLTKYKMLSKTLTPEEKQAIVDLTPEQLDLTQPTESRIPRHETTYEEFADLQEVDFGDFGSRFDDTKVLCQLHSDRHEYLTMQDFRKFTTQYYTNRQGFQYPNGESSDAIHIRCNSIIETMQNIVTAGLVDNLVIVGHNRFFRHLLVELGIWSYRNMFDAKLPHGELFEISIDKIKGHQ